MEVTDDEDENVSVKKGDSAEERIRFMYSAFPDTKSTNPRHWDSKLSYWIQEITSSSQDGEPFCFSLEKLKERFKRNDRYPSGLDVVVDEMTRQGLLCPIEDFTNSLKQSWKEWGISVVNQSFWRILSAGSPSKDKKAVFSVVNIVKEESEKFLEMLRTGCSSYGAGAVTVLPWNVAMKRYEAMCDRHIIDDEFSSLVGYLYSMKKMKLASLDNGTRILKFAIINDTIVKDIDDVDLAVIRLKQTTAKLKISIAHDNGVEQSLKSKILVLHHQGDTNKAKILLKELKKIRQLLMRKNDALQSLNDNLLLISESKTLEEITLALQCSAKALKSAYTGPVLSQENVDNVIDDLQESQSIVDEVGSLLVQDNCNGSRLTKIEEDELQLELKALCLDADITNATHEHLTDANEQQKTRVLSTSVTDKDHLEDSTTLVSPPPAKDRSTQKKASKTRVASLAH